MNETPKVEQGGGLAWIRGSGLCRDWNGIHYKLGLSGKNVGATQLSMNVAVIPPGGVAAAHIHVGFEVMLYILEGRVRHEHCRSGRRRRRAIERRRVGSHRAVRTPTPEGRGLTIRAQQPSITCDLQTHGLCWLALPLVMRSDGYRYRDQLKVLKESIEHEPSPP